jgi:hypothetical protein
MREKRQKAPVQVQISYSESRWPYFAKSKFPQGDGRGWFRNYRRLGCDGLSSAEEIADLSASRKSSISYPPFEGYPRIRIKPTSHLFSSEYPTSMENVKL